MNNDFGDWCQGRYGKIKDVEIHHGKIHQLLGIELDFSSEGECKVRQFDHVRNMIEIFLKKLVRRFHSSLHLTTSAREGKAIVV